MENKVLEGGDFLNINPTDNHLMHIIIQKPRENSTIEQQMHYMAHLQAWIDTGKQMNSQANGTMQAIQASTASSNQAQMQAQNKTSIPSPQ